MLQDSYVIYVVALTAALLLAGGGLVLLRQRLRAAEAVATQQQRECRDMELAYLNAPLGLAMLDRQLRYLRINRLLADINGISIKDHLGKTVRKVVPNLADQVEQPFLHVIRTGEPMLGLVFEGTTAAQPGKTRFWRENVYPIQDDKGDIIGINVSVEEITEEKRLNDALRASEARERERAAEMEAVMNAAPAAIFLAHDVSCSHMYGNEEGRRLLRLRPGENGSANRPGVPSPCRFTEMRTGTPLRPHQLPLQLAAATGKEVRGAELTLSFDNGDVVHVLCNAVPLLGIDGKPAGALCAFIDITAQRQVEQVIIQEGQRKDAFLATLAHELRNPLASIQSGLEIMKLSPLDTPAMARARDVMSRQLSHLVHLIDDLLDVSRINSGKLELKKEKIDLRKVVQDALDINHLHIEAFGHELQLELPPSPLMVDADQVRLEQVIGNLLNNAAKYTPERGCITVTVAAEEKRAVIRISDNGIGIDKEMLPKLFNMFAQLEDGRGRRNGGMGVGLSLARQIVELHGGTLGAQSAGPRQGSTFDVRLPLCEPAMEEMKARDTAPSRHEDCPPMKRILVVDDNEDAAEALSALLGMAGNTVQLAFTGNDAIRRAREFEPEIAFIDVGLPDISGLEVAKSLRKEASLQRATLIALTGWGSDKDRQRTKEAGFDYHLTKPASIDAIRHVLPGLKMPC